jgi:prepilin-type N-terminal cleavage/methylation domain-containing protein
MKDMRSRKGFTLIELIIVIVILGIISGVAIPKYLNLVTSAKVAAARGLGAAISSTISAEHADYLVNENDYTLSDVLGDTQFSGGVIYNSASGSSPVSGEISFSGNTIYLNYKDRNFTWTYTDRSGTAFSYITEGIGF